MIGSFTESWTDRRCVRCREPSNELNWNWDPRGPICLNCWLEDADRRIQEQREVEEQAERDYWKECEG